MVSRSAPVLVTGATVKVTEIAEVLTRGLGVPLSALDMTMEEAAEPECRRWVPGHELHEVVGQPARPQDTRGIGIPLTGFEERVRRVHELRGVTPVGPVLRHGRRAARRDAGGGSTAGAQVPGERERQEEVGGRVKGELYDEHR